MKLVFQPAEEGGAGGQLMVDGGAIEGVDMAFAIHVAPKVRDMCTSLAMDYIGVRMMSAWRPLHGPCPFTLSSHSHHILNPLTPNAM